MKQINPIEPQNINHIGKFMKFNVKGMSLIILFNWDVSIAAAIFNFYDNEFNEFAATTNFSLN